MARARAIIKRRKAVQNIHKITRTMQLIATARFQQAHNRVLAGQPYVEKLSEVVGYLWELEGVAVDHPLLRTNPESLPVLVIVITSNRGLCGGYNASVLRKALGFIEELESQRKTVLSRVIGKKGIHYFTFLGREMEAAHTEFGDRPSYEQVAGLAEELIGRYSRCELNSVWVAYMHFVSAGVQRPEVMRLLPFERPAASEAMRLYRTVQWDFSPDPQELLCELLPQAVEVKFYHCLLEAILSEHVARMVAMKAATDAASDMIKYLTLRYNRARQTQITMELLDIVGGSEAVK